MHPVTGLSLARIAAGATTLAKPELAAKLFGFDAVASPQLPLTARLFASREVALGLATLVSRGGARRRLSALGMFVDASDTWAAYDALQRDQLPRVNGMLLVAPSAGAVLAGAVGVLGRSNRKSSDNA